MLIILPFWSEELDSLFWGDVAPTNPSPESRLPDTVLHIIWNKYPKRYFSIQNLTIQAFILTSISFQLKYHNTVLPTPKIYDLQESAKKWKTFSSWVNYFILKVVKPEDYLILL